MGVGMYEGLLSAYNRWCSGKVTKGWEFVIVKIVGVTANRGEGGSGG